jgi:hypothetical protein
MQLVELEVWADSRKERIAIAEQFPQLDRDPSIGLGLSRLILRNCKTQEANARLEVPF